MLYGLVCSWKPSTAASVECCRIVSSREKRKHGCAATILARRVAQTTVSRLATRSGWPRSVGVQPENANVSDCGNRMSWDSERDNGGGLRRATSPRKVRKTTFNFLHNRSQQLDL